MREPSSKMLNMPSNRLSWRESLFLAYALSEGKKEDIALFSGHLHVHRISAANHADDTIS
jgi:hypothetical protein